MQRVSVHIPNSTRDRIRLISQAKGEDESTIIRQALEKGLPLVQPQDKSSRALHTLSQLAKKIPTQGEIPQDAIDNMDYYTWGGEKRV